MELFSTFGQTSFLVWLFEGCVFAILELSGFSLVLINTIYLLDVCCESLSSGGAAGKSYYTPSFVQSMELLSF